MVDRCMDAYGRIDILHNNVGIAIVGGPVGTSEESWDHVNAVNLKSMYLTCKYVLPVMEKQGRGSVINISSGAAIRYVGYPLLAYSATKSGILGLTKDIALQYAEKTSGPIH